MSQVFYPLRVLGVQKELDGMATTVLFDVPEELSDTFAWYAGQHLAIRFVIAGQEFRRSYSIASSPVSGDAMQITVKRVMDGLVSNHISSTLKTGDTLDVMPPFGSFYLDAQPGERRTHYFFGAGSGITPLYAMLHSVLCNEPHSFVYLLCGNKDADTILFEQKLSTLVERYGKRIDVFYVLSAPSLWARFRYWRKGHIDAAAIAAFITEKPPIAQNTQYYICGPGDMNLSVKTVLMSLDVPSNRIHSEHFGGASLPENTTEGVAATASVTIHANTVSVPIASDQSVLAAVRQAGLNPPFSCQSGVCGACKALLTEGAVHMRARMALEDDEIESGCILTCQSVPASETLSLTYPDRS